MTEQEIKQKIKECQDRQKHYKLMFEHIEDYKLALVRSYTTEGFNITDYKKKLKELRSK